jgi:hypothetical protein
MIMSSGKNKRAAMPTRWSAPIVKGFDHRGAFALAAQVALVAGSTCLAACTGSAQIQATTPPPPTATVSVNASADTSAAAAPANATVDATASADVPPPIETTDSDPEELTATTEPPEPVYEEQTDVPGPGYYWVGGYWGWSGTDWAWYPGQWLVQPEGRIYVAPYYERVGGNVVFVRGYWGPRGGVAVRSYGGDRIVFSAAVRPANYHRGDHVVIEHRSGDRPGTRPAGAYVHASGSVRAVPHDTMPRRVAARDVAQGHREAAAGGREAAAGRQESTAGRQEAAAGHRETDQGRAETAQGRADVAEGNTAKGHAELNAGHAEQAQGHAEQAQGHAMQAQGHAEQAQGHAMQAQGHAEVHAAAPHAAPPPKKKK